MNQAIQPGETIYADGVPFDDWWIETLYSVVLSDGFAGFNIAHSDLMLLPLLTPIEDDKLGALDWIGIQLYYSPT